MYICIQVKKLNKLKKNIMTNFVIKESLVRFSYPYLFTPNQPMKPTDKPKYSVTLLIPKKDTALVERMKAAIQEEKVEKWGSKIPKGVKNPLLDGDDEKFEDKEGYAGHWVLKLSCSTDYPPKVYKGANNTEIQDPAELYAGSWGLASFTFFGYGDPSKGINYGVSTILKSVKFIKNGEKLGGSGSPSSSSSGEEFGDAFDDIAEETDDFDLDM